MSSEGMSRGPHNLGEHTPGMGSKQEQRPDERGMERNSPSSASHTHLLPFKSSLDLSMFAF